MPYAVVPLGRPARHPSPRRRQRRAPSAFGSFLIALALVVGALWAHGRLTGPAPTVASTPIVPSDLGVPSFGGSVVGSSARMSWPAVPADARNQALAQPPAQHSRSTHFAFIGTVRGPDGEPVRWDPCRPIHIVINFAAAPAGADKLLKNGLAEVSRDTGLRFVIDGPTNEPPSSSRPSTDPARYGNRWSPVLVAWTDPRAVPELDGAVAGLGGPAGAPYSSPEDKHWVSGTVYLDGPTFSRVLTRPGDGWLQAQAIVLHELGHLVGLAHVQDSAQLMAPRNSGQLRFADGDLEGLRRLGSGPCFSH